VLPILVDKSFLEGKEVEHLAMVSHVLHETATNADIWKSLCSIHYPCTHELSSDFVEKAGYRRLYWMWKAVKKTSTSQAKMPPPSCTLDDIQLLVYITYKGETCASFSVRGEKLRKLLEQRDDYFQLPTPVVLGPARFLKCISNNAINPAEWSEDERARQCYDGKRPLAVWNDKLHREDFRVAIHIFRRNDMAMCCCCGPGNDELFFPTTIPLVEIGEKVDPNSPMMDARGYGVTSMQGSIFTLYDTERDGLSMRKSPLSAEILTRLGGAAVFFSSSLVIEVLQGQLVLTRLDLSVLVVPHEDHDYEAFTSTYFEGSGLNLLHILSELEGTTCKK
jgi:hypothetical protein